jgi:transcription termination factor Rho
MPTSGANHRRALLTALTDTSGQLDEVIFEVFKGTGHKVLYLDRCLADRRVCRPPT